MHGWSATSGRRIAEHRRTTTIARRIVGVIASLSMLVGALGLLVLVPASTASADPSPAPLTPTTVTVVVEPAGELSTYTPATYRVLVSPIEATGTVTLLGNGQPLGTVQVVSGQAVVESASRPAGELRLTASFTPTPGSTWAPSASDAVVVQVRGDARVWLTGKGGAVVPPGSKVEVGSTVSVRLDGFPAGVAVRLTLGARALPGGGRTDGQGRAAIGATVPKDLPSGTYLLGAAGGLSSASFVFYVYNPPPPAATTSTTPSGTGSSGTTTPPDTQNVSVSIGGSTTGGGTLPGTGDPGGSSGGSLAHTGGQPLELVALALVAIVGGAALSRAAREPEPRGAHELGGILRAR